LLGRVIKVVAILAVFHIQPFTLFQRSAQIIESEPICQLF